MSLQSKYLRWARHYRALVLSLSRLLQTQFAPGASSAKGPLGESLLSIPTLLEQGDIPRLEFEMTRLGMLRDMLEVLDQHDKRVLKKLRPKLIRGDVGEYFGARKEAEIACGLITLKIPYTHPDPPDFVVTTPGGTIALECSSAHLARDDKPGEPVLHKIAKIFVPITSKAGKPYCVPTTALVIDCTNIFQRLTRATGGVDTDAVLQHVTPVAAGTSFGSVLLTHLAMDLDTRRLEPGYNRIDHANIDPALKRFLDEFFGTAETREVRNYAFPSRP